MVDIQDLEMPGWSRNFGVINEEEEEAHIPTEDPFFFWSPCIPTMDKKYRCKLLLFGLGQQAATFLNCSLNEKKKSMELIGTLVLPECPLSNSNFISSDYQITTAALVYRLLQADKKTKTKIEQLEKTKDNKEKHGQPKQQKETKNEENKQLHDVLVVICNGLLPVNRYFKWTDTLFKHIEPMEISILEGMHEGSYINSFNTEKPDPPILKSLSTDGKKKSTHACCDPLELSNIVNSLGASVITHCQVFGLPATLFVSVYGIHCMLESIMAFEPVMRNLQQSYKDMHQVESFLKQSYQRRRKLYLTWLRKYKPGRRNKLSGENNSSFHIRESDPNLRMPTNIFA